MAGFGDRTGRGAPASIKRAFRREEDQGLTVALWGRLLVLGLLLLYVLVALPWSRSAGYGGAIVGFMALGVAPHLIRRHIGGGVLVTGIFLTLDVALLTYLLVVPPPFFGDAWTPQLNLRIPNFLFLGIFLVGMALSYSPVLVVWTGAAAIVAWSAGVLWVANLPESLALSSKDSLDRNLSPKGVIETLLDPNYVSLTTWYNQLLFLALVTLILAMAVWRSRRLALRQVEAEAARSNLARYFSPNIVDEIARDADQLDHAKIQPAAVLFADIVGFTAMSERMAPGALVDTLREFHSRAADTVFEFGGTLDKYIGDSVMAHFGTPTPAEDDAERALRCAIAMVERTRDWNATRTAGGEEPVRIGVGLHVGDVIVGNVGDARRLEYTVLGDTVNVGSRLERLTREIGAPVVVSGDVVRAVRRRPGTEALLARLEPGDTRTLRGRSAGIEVWTCAAAEPPTPAAPPPAPSAGAAGATAGSPPGSRTS